MTASNHQVVLARRPSGMPVPEDFRFEAAAIVALEPEQFRVKNQYLSMDAGFLHWMHEGSGDDYLPEMALGAPVIGLILGEVVESRNDSWPVGARVMGRLAWESSSVAGPDDFLTRLPDEVAFPENYYLGVLGGTGMTAYFGLADIGKPQAGETVLVSAAAGAVGNVVGQLAKIAGARVVGMTGSEEKAHRLRNEAGFDEVINYRTVGDLDHALQVACSDGIDVYFDNVGGETLNAALRQINTAARVVLCGSLAAYGAQTPPPGPTNLFDLVTKRALMKGFMYTDEIARYPEAMEFLAEHLRSGALKNFEYELPGLNNAGVAFCDMLSGKNLGKTIVRLG